MKSINNIIITKPKYHCSIPEINDILKFIFKNKILNHNYNLDVIDNLSSKEEEDEVNKFIHQEIRSEINIHLVKHGKIEYIDKCDVEYSIQYR